MGWLPAHSPSRARKRAYALSDTSKRMRTRLTNPVLRGTQPDHPRLGKFPAGEVSLDAEGPLTVIRATMKRSFP